MAIDLSNLLGKETLKIIFQKIKGVRTELQTAIDAKSDFSGDYNDLENKPTEMKNPESITFTGAATGEYDGSSPLTVNIPTLSAANDTTLGGIKAAAKTAGDTVPAKIGSDNILYVPTYPTELPASDVHDWAKAENKPSYTPTEVGVIGTAPTDGEVAVFDGTTGKIKSTGFTIEKSVPADAEFTDTTYGVMGGASTSEAGTEGLVPAPEAGNHNSYLRGDGTWAVPTDTTYDVMTGASADAAGESGLVPTPEAGAQNKFLRGDGTWQTPTDTTYGAAGTELGLVKTGGDVTITDGVITVNDDSHNHTIGNVEGLQDALNGKLGKTETAAAATKLATARKITVDGDATGEVTFDGSVDKTLTVTIADMTGASASAAGTAGFVPAPGAGKQTSFLRGDGTWVIPTDTKYSNATQSTAGLMSAADKTKLDGFSAASNYVLKSDLSSVYKYKGTVANDAALPSDSVEVGDVYNITTSATYGDGANVAWTGSAWDNLGATIDLSGYVETADLQEIGSEEVEAVWNEVFSS